MARTPEFGKTPRAPRRHSHGTVIVQQVVESEWTKWVRTLKIIGGANGFAFLAGRLKGYW